MFRKQYVHVSRLRLFKKKVKSELALVEKVCACKYVNTVDVVVHIKNLGNTKYII